jgi:four helix bundle protein
MVRGVEAERARGRAGERAMAIIEGFRDLRVYQSAFQAAMRIFEITKAFPNEERYSMIDQVRRSSRSVCANIAEAWRKRRYKAHFVSKLSDAESEAEETRVWLEFALRCGYLDKSQFEELDDNYDKVISQLVRMLAEPGKWSIH